MPAVRLHRCPATWFASDRHACWRVEHALRDQGVEYTVVAAWGLPRSRRRAVIAGTGQNRFPAIEFDDGSWYREESEEMAVRIRAGGLFDRRGTKDSVGAG